MKNERFPGQLELRLFVNPISPGQSQKNPVSVSNADRKVFANPESFATSLLLAAEFPDTLQYKISR